MTRRNQQVIVLDATSADPGPSIGRPGNPFWEQLRGLVRHLHTGADLERASPVEVLYFQTDPSKLNEMIAFNQAVARHPALYGRATSTGPTGFQKPRMTDFAPEIVVISGPMTEMLEKGLPNYVEAALRSASLVVAHGTVSLHLYEQWRLKDGDTLRPGVGLLPALAPAPYRSGTTPIMKLLGSRPLHYYDGTPIRNALAQPSRLTMAEFGSYVPRSEPPRPPRRRSVIAVGGTPDGGFDSEEGMRLLRAASILTEPMFRSTPDVIRYCSINVGKGDETLVELQLSALAAAIDVPIDMVFARVARPYAEELDRDTMIRGADVVVVNGGVGSARIALLERHRMNEPIDWTIENGAVGLTLSDGVGRMAEWCIGGIKAPELFEGGGQIKGGVVLHTENPDRYRLMLDSVKSGLLPSPTYGIPTDVFIQFVDGIPVEAHATNWKAARKARYVPLRKDQQEERNYHCPVRVELVDGRVVETPLYVEPFHPTFGWIRSGRSFLRDVNNAPAFAAAVAEFNTLRPEPGPEYWTTHTSGYVLV